MLARLQLRAKHTAIFIGIMTVSITAINWILEDSKSKMTRFRDKSALFGRELKPGEPPSW